MSTKLRRGAFDMEYLNSVRDNCAVQAINTASEPKEYCNIEKYCNNAKDLSLPVLPGFSSCNYVTKGSVKPECCGNLTVTKMLVPITLLFLLIILILFLRHWKRRVSRVAVDITNVTGRQKKTSIVTLVNVSNDVTKDSNGINPSGAGSTEVDSNGSDSNEAEVTLKEVP